MTLSRRSILAGSLALGANVVRAGAAFDVDAVVVGAGVAGLAAAQTLRRRGKTCLVLEARPRIGGRVLTETGLGAPYEAGAFYIHWAERNPLTALAAAEGIATTADTVPNIRSFDDGVETSQAMRAQRSGDFARLSALLDREDEPDVSMAEIAHRATPPLDAAAAGIARLALGEEPTRVSALDYARLWSGGDLVVPSGYSGLVGALARGADVRLSTPVRSVDWSGPGVAVETDNGTIRARAAIVTVPIGVLKADGVRFRPDLPAATRNALDGIGMGALSKIGLSFDVSRFNPPRGDIFSRDGASLFDFDCRPLDRDVVVAIFGGEFARTITRTERDAVQTALDALVAVAGSDARRAFREGKLHAWHAEPFSLGAYSHCEPGHAGARDVLAQPLADRVYFAGEATAPVGGAMTTGGAYLAGQAAAEQVAAR